MLRRHSFVTLARTDETHAGMLSRPTRHCNAHMMTSPPVLQDGATFFCATPLAASLCGGTGAASTDAAAGAGGKGGGASALESSAYIIVETNFRVCYAELTSRAVTVFLGGVPAGGQQNRLLCLPHLPDHPRCNVCPTWPACLHRPCCACWLA